MVITAATLPGNLTGSVSGDTVARSRATSPAMYGDCGVICGNVSGDIGGDVREIRGDILPGAIIKGDVRLLCGSNHGTVYGDIRKNKSGREKDHGKRVYKNISEILEDVSAGASRLSRRMPKSNSCTPSSCQ